MTSSDARVRDPGNNATSRQSAVSIDVPFLPVLQKLGSLDRSHIEAHLLRLEAADRQMRFCGMVSDQSICTYSEQIDWSETNVLWCFVDGELRGMAELKVAGFAATAELAITVEQSFQNKGIGTALLRRMLTIARNRFVARVYIICVLENRRMQQVARKLQADLVFREGEVEGSIWPSVPTYLSLIEEASMDGQALWRAIFGISPKAEHR